MRPRGGNRRDRAWVCALLSLASCGSHIDEDAKACAGYACTAGTCQAGANGPECVCGAAEQAMHLTCTLLVVDQGTDDDRDHARLISPNTDVAGEISVPAAFHHQDVDVYRFEATAGRVYLIEVTSGPALDIRIEDAAGNYQTGLYQMTASGSTARLAMPSEGGAEYITLSASDPNVIGQYVLRVTDLAPAAESSTLGPAPASVEGTIAPAGEVDQFILSVDEGVIYDVTCTFDAALPGNAVVAGFGTPTRFKVASGVTYGLSVGGGQTAVGKYRCELQRAAVQDDAGDTVDTALLLPGPPASFDGRKDAQIDLDVFAIQSHAGKYLWAHTSGCFVSFIPGPGQQLITGYWGSDAHPGLLGNELAYVQVLCRDDESTYHLTVDELTDAEANTAATAATVDEGSISGRLEGPEDQDVFLFQAQARHVYTLDIPVFPGWQLTGMHVERSTLRGTPYQAVFVPEATGTLILTLGWSDVLHTPLAYAANLQDTGLVDPEPDLPADAIPGQVGVPVHGEFQFDGDSDCFAFDLPATTTMTVEVDRGEPTVWSPDGNQISAFSPYTFETGAGGRYAVCVWYAGSLGGGQIGGTLEQVQYTLGVHP